jgi:hypothetical protein
VDGHGNKDFIFPCSNTYSSVFQKKGEGQGFLTLNIVQPFNNTLTKIQEITRHGVPLVVGGSLNLTKQITDLLDPINFDMYPQTNSSKNALDTGHPLNTTLRVMITEPNGLIILSNDTAAQYYHFSPTVYPPIKPHVAGKYTFSIRNLGDNPTDLHHIRQLSISNHGNYPQCD